MCSWYHVWIQGQRGNEAGAEGAPGELKVTLAGERLVEALNEHVSIRGRRGWEAVRGGGGTWQAGGISQSRVMALWMGLHTGG
jgi:hypothetical protein